MSSVTLYGIALPKPGQTKLVNAVEAGELCEGIWDDLAKYLFKRGFRKSHIRMAYGEDKASHKQLSCLIVAGLPADMSTAYNKPAKSRTAKEKELAALAQNRCGVYRVRLGDKLGALESTDNNGGEKVEKTTAHKAAEYILRAIRALEPKDGNLSGLPVGYKLSEEKEILKRAYRTLAGQAYKSADGSK